MRTQTLRSRIGEIFSADYRPDRRSLAIILFAIFALALALRIARSFQLDIMSKDAALYLWMAEDIAANGFDNAFAMNPRLPPLHILLIALGIKLGLHPETAGALISILSGALLIFPVFFIARRLFRSFLPCAFSALLMAIYPDLARIGAEKLRDPLFHLFSISALWMIIEGVKSGKLIFHLAAGISVAIATATRSEGIEVIIAYILFCGGEIIFPFADSAVLRQRTKRIIICVAVFMASFAAVAMPFEYAMSKTMSKWHVIDTRIQDYLKLFLAYPKSEIDPKIK